MRIRHKTKRIDIFFIVFLFLCPYILRAEESAILSLDEAVQIALRDNRDILLSQEDVKKAKEKISESRSGFFPSLGFTGTWSDTRGLYAKDISSTSTQFTLKQYLYQGGKTINTIKFNGYNFETAEAILDKTKSEVLTNVIKAFSTSLLSAELATLNKSILDNTQEHLESLRIRYNNGQASETDILELESSISSLKQAYAESLSQAESARALLKNLLYLKEDAQIEPKGEFAFEAQELAYDEAFLKAMKMRPEIRQYEAQKEASKKAIEIAKAEGRPSVYASWDYYSRSNISATTQKNWNDYHVFGLTFSWPVFDGWQTKAKVQQAIIDLREAELLKERAVKDISLELKEAYLALKDALSQLGASDVEIKFYEANLKSAEQKYSAGIISALELSDADLKYKVSLFNKNESVYDYVIAKSDFEKATGGI